MKEIYYSDKERERIITNAHTFLKNVLYNQSNRKYNPEDLISLTAVTPTLLLTVECYIHLKFKIYVSLNEEMTLNDIVTKIVELMERDRWNLTYLRLEETIEEQQGKIRLYY